MSKHEDPIQRFMSTSDLEGLRKPLVFPKSSSFVNYQRKSNSKWFMWIGCAPCYAPKAVFSPEELLDHFALELRQETIVATFPVNWFCSVNDETCTVFLDNIVNVTLIENKHLASFGLKQLQVWTFDDTQQTGASLTASWLANPEQARDAILLAVNLRKAATGRVPLQFTTSQELAALRAVAAMGGSSRGGEQQPAADTATATAIITRV